MTRSGRKSGLLGRGKRASRFLDSSLPVGAWGAPSPTSDPTHQILQKLRELTKDHGSEEKQQFPPGFPLGAHYSYNSHATGEPLGWEELRDPTRWDWTPAARLSPARLSLHAWWAAPGCPKF